MLHPASSGLCSICGQKMCKKMSGNQQRDKCDLFPPEALLCVLCFDCGSYSVRLSCHCNLLPFCTLSEATVICDLKGEALCVCVYMHVSEEGRRPPPLNLHCWKWGESGESGVMGFFCNAVDNHSILWSLAGLCLCERPLGENLSRCRADDGLVVSHQVIPRTHKHKTAIQISTDLNTQTYTCSSN